MACGKNMLLILPNVPLSVVLTFPPNRFVFRDVIEAQDAVNFVRKRLGKKMDLQQIAIELVNAALDRGSVDNTTAIIVAFHCNSNSTPDKSSTK